MVATLLPKGGSWEGQSSSVLSSVRFPEHCLLGGGMGEASLAPLSPDWQLHREVQVFTSREQWEKPKNPGVRLLGLGSVLVLFCAPASP